MTTRAEFIEIGRSWIGTRYILGGQIKGAGCDCATYPYCVLREAGLIPEEHIGIFKGDWWAHEKEEIYVRRMLRHAYKVAEAICTISAKPDPGNIVLAKVAGSKIYNHAAIVTKWPYGIEAIQPCVMESNLATSSLWAFQQMIIFDPFRNEAA